jgi:hypothetical protein
VHSDSEAIRGAEPEAVDLQRRKDTLRLEAEAAAADSDDAAEAMGVRTEMDALAVMWVEGEWE